MCANVSVILVYDMYTVDMYPSQYDEDSRKPTSVIISVRTENVESLQPPHIAPGGFWHRVNTYQVYETVMESKNIILYILLKQMALKLSF